MNDDVSPDGCPTAVYLALPAGEAPALIDGAVRPAGTILELGSGPGRITTPLAAMGRRVTAVDIHAPMLEHIQTAQTVEADLFSLDLERSFDGVVAASHLINHPEAARRAQLLDVCQKHTKPDGVVLVERYDPEWAADPEPHESMVGRVLVSFVASEMRGDSFDGTVTYTLDDQSWTQAFSAACVTDEMLRVEAAQHGLRLDHWIDSARRWACLVPIHTS